MTERELKTYALIGVLARFEAEKLKLPEAIDKDKVQAEIDKLDRYADELVEELRRL